MRSLVTPVREPQCWEDLRERQREEGREEERETSEEVQLFQSPPVGFFPG